jgi:Holliday junction resolvase RusA-like endonuclease
MEKEMIIFESDVCPPSANTYYRNFRGRMVLSKQGREFKKCMHERCSKRQLGRVKGQVRVNIDIRFKDKRHRDLDNHFKAIFDAFKNVLFDDDVEVAEIHSTRTFGCKENPGFTMEIRSCPAITPTCLSPAEKAEQRV